MSNWDIPRCLYGDFNVVRFPYERFTACRMTSTMIEFFDFIDSCNLIDPPLESIPYTWSSHEEVSVLPQIDQFCLRVNGGIISKGTPGYPS